MTGDEIPGEWMKRDRWPVSHFVRSDIRTTWMGDERGRTACGRVGIAVEELEEEPIGIDTVNRCERCRARVGGEP